MDTVHLEPPQLFAKVQTQLTSLVLIYWKRLFHFVTSHFIHVFTLPLFFFTLKPSLLQLPLSPQQFTLLCHFLLPTFTSLNIGIDPSLALFINYSLNCSTCHLTVHTQASLLNFHFRLTEFNFTQTQWIKFDSSKSEYYLTQMINSIVLTINSSSIFLFHRLLSSLLNNSLCKQANFTSAAAAAASTAGAKLPKKVEQFVQEKAKLCQPDRVHICDGSQAENEFFLKLMEKQGMAIQLPKYENW